MPEGLRLLSSYPIGLLRNSGFCSAKDKDLCLGDRPENAVQRDKDLMKRPWQPGEREPAWRGQMPTSKAQVTCRETSPLRRIASLLDDVHIMASGVPRLLSVSEPGIWEMGENSRLIHSFTMALKTTYQHSVNRQPLNGDKDENEACVRVCVGRRAEPGGSGGILVPSQCWAHAANF